jgi:hypothetical protein
MGGIGMEIESPTVHTRSTFSSPRNKRLRFHVLRVHGKRFGHATRMRSRLRGRGYTLVHYNDNDNKQGEGVPDLTGLAPYAADSR